MDGQYILVADDDAEQREALQEVLTSLGFPSRAVEDGQQALDAVQRARPAMLLLDLHMPVMSGWALLDALKEEPAAKGLPVVVISGYGYEWEAELIGAMGYIRKPVDVNRLKDTISRLLGGPAAMAMQ